MEPKDMGLAIKDIVLGLGGAVAGVAGGPAAATAVAKAGSGIDRLIGESPPAEKTSRGERFDRADFGARPPQQQPASTKPAAPPAAKPPTPPPEPEEEPAEPTGDADIATEYLRSVGWSAERVEGILSGPSPKGAQPEGTETASTRPVPKEALRTFEIYGVRSGQVVPLMDVLERRDGQWHVAAGAQVRATDRSTVGMGLAGAPGKWGDYYPNQRPEAYGLHAGKAVLYWEPKRGRALAASAGLLSQLFGRNWRSTVYRTEEQNA